MMERVMVDDDGMEIDEPLMENVGVAKGKNRK